MTAKEYLFEFLQRKGKLSVSTGREVEEIMIEFAQYHVTKALEEASKKSVEHLEFYNSEYDNIKKSVEEAYPLDNIK